MTTEPKTRRLKSEVFPEASLPPWYDKSNERIKGTPLSRVPEWCGPGYQFDNATTRELALRLEELLVAYDRLRVELSQARDNELRSLRCNEEIVIELREVRPQGEKARQEGFKAAREKACTWGMKEKE